MRISELAAASGIPLPTVKYYLREGLLPAGRRTGRNQADYGDEHVVRLRLVRALVEVGGLSIADTRRVLEASEDPKLPLFDLLGAAHAAVTNRAVPTRSEPEWTGAREVVKTLARQRGWQVEDDTPALDRAADATAAFVAMDVPELLPFLEVYAETAEELARKEVDAVMTMGSESNIVRGVVVGTVLGEALFNSLRLLAQQSASAKALGVAVPAVREDPREEPDDHQAGDG